MPHRPRPNLKHAATIASLAAVFLSAGCGSSSESREGLGATTVSPSMVSPAPADLLLRSDSWTFEETPGILLTTPNYRIYTTSTRQTLRDRLPRFLELALHQYTTSLVDLPSPPVTLETYLLSNRPQWTRMTQRLMGEDAEVYLKIQRGGFAAEGRAILYEIGPHDTYAISAHEGWHQFTQKTFRDPLPVWLEEGIACYMEGFRWDTREPGRPEFMPWANVERFDELRDASRAGTLMPLQKLVRSTPQELMAQNSALALTYYAQLWAMVHFLNEWNDGEHRAQLQLFLLDASLGRVSNKLAATAGARASHLYQSRRPVPQLFETYFGASPDAMDADYREFVANITRVGAKQQIAAGVSPYVKSSAP